MQDRDLSKIPFLPNKGLDGFGLKSPHWFWKQDGSCLQMVGYLPTRTNMQTYISGFVASLPLHKTTKKTALIVHCALLIPPSAPLCPTTPRGFSPWICTTGHWIGVIGSLAQGQSPSSRSVLTLLPFPLHSSSPEMSVVLIQLQSPAGACHGTCPNCSSLAVVGLLTEAFQLGLKTVSSWCFPTRNVLLQIVQCVQELWMKEGREYLF